MGVPFLLPADARRTSARSSGIGRSWHGAPSAPARPNCSPTPRWASSGLAGGCQRVRNGGTLAALAPAGNRAFGIARFRGRRARALCPSERSQHPHPARLLAPAGRATAAAELRPAAPARVQARDARHVAGRTARARARRGNRPVHGGPDGEIARAARPSPRAGRRRSPTRTPPRAPSRRRGGTIFTPSRTASTSTRRPPTASTIQPL